MQRNQRLLLKSKGTSIGKPHYFDNFWYILIHFVSVVHVCVKIHVGFIRMVFLDVW